MRAWERVSNVIQVVYRIGRTAEAVASRHAATAKQFFDYGDLVAVTKQAKGDDWDPDSDSTTSRRRLIEVLGNLVKLSTEAAEAYQHMAEALETCIDMVKESMPPTVENRNN